MKFPKDRGGAVKFLYGLKNKNHPLSDNFTSFFACGVQKPSPCRSPRRPFVKSTRIFVRTNCLIDV